MIRIEYLYVICFSEAQPQVPQKDKSLWRKSTLNVPNSSEEADPRYLKRLNLRASMENVLASSTLQVITKILAFLLF